MIILKWISVKDRLPDFDDPVLWLDEACNIFVSELDKDGNAWLDGEDLIEGTKVTHWRPLPAPPNIELI